MIERMTYSPDGIAGLDVSGTVVAHDVSEALRMIGQTDRLLVAVAPRFDGYMAELVGGMQRACRDGQAGRCALVVPDTMIDEAELRGQGGNFRVFARREAAESWLSA